jgi:hypothetical protein
MNCQTSPYSFFFFSAICCSPLSVTRAMILGEMFLSTLVAAQGEGIKDTPALCKHGKYT